MICPVGIGLQSMENGITAKFVALALHFMGISETLQQTAMWRGGKHAPWLKLDSYAVAMK